MTTYDLQWSLWVSDFRLKDKQVDSIPLQQPPFVDWQGCWICATRDKTARGVALCWTYKSWARQCQVSKRIAQLSKVSPSLSLCLLLLLFIFFSASELLCSHPSHSISIYFTPTPSTPRALPPPPQNTSSRALPHPPSHLSLFTPPRISSLAIKTHSSPVVALIRLPPSRRLFLLPYILPSTSLSPPFDFN